MNILNDYPPSGRRCHWGLVPNKTTRATKRAGGVLIWRRAAGLKDSRFSILRPVNNSPLRNEKRGLGFRLPEKFRRANERKFMAIVHDTARALMFFENKISFTTGPVELEHRIKDGDDVVIVDVRDMDDYAKGHIPGAINLPRGTWDDPQGLSKDKVNIVYCYTQTCHLGAQACAVFAAKFFPVMEVEGGFAAWKDNDFEVETGSRKAERAFSR
jgi:rhodanese-related sulfurtransferase